MLDPIHDQTECLALCTCKPAFFLLIRREWSVGYSPESVSFIFMCRIGTLDLVTPNTTVVERGH